MINQNDTLIVAIDIQDKLVKMLENGEKIAKNATNILKMAHALNMPVIITEQYPKGLGSTIADIKNICDFKTIEKTSFSAYQTNEFEEELKKYDIKNIVIFGIETHICLYQTVLDLLAKNYNVYVVCDCSSSREKSNHKTALKLMAQKNAYITTFEIVLFELLKSSKHPNFKELQALIK